MNVLAYDFGASSGRLMLGKFENNKITLKEIHRFNNEPVYMNGGLFWDLPRLFYEIKQGLLKAKSEQFESIGIDTWGVDYGLISRDGDIIGNPYHYRDTRTENIMQLFGDVMDEKELYFLSGIQNMTFNTVFQLFAMKENQKWMYNEADKFLMIPDLFGYLLTGEKYCEYSVASTTQLLNPHTKEWNTELIEKLGIKNEIFPKLVLPGTKIGKLKEEICEELGIDEKLLIAVAGHDTASAVVAVPACEKDFSYISCGTWSLFGTELDKPCINEKSAQMNITNEVGYNGTTRFLKNISGLWMIQETRRQFKREGKEYNYADMEKLARDAEPFKCFIDPDAPIFALPGNQPERIREFCRKTEQYVPQNDGEIIRCIYESLAMKYRYTFEKLKECTEKDFKTIHMVGGGTKDNFLCEMTADATGVKVLAGPVEATSLGNVAVQLIAMGKIKDMDEARKIIRNSFEVKEYIPEQTDTWDKAYQKFVHNLLK